MGGNLDGINSSLLRYSGRFVLSEKFPGVRESYLRKTVAVILLCHLVTAAWGQKANSERPSNDPYYHDWKAELYEDGIQDNSFLIEEAYNQDYGVVQHINNFTW